MSWNPNQYLKFSDHRQRPAVELLARVGCPQAQRIVDLGCGAGNVTELLRQRWPTAGVTGTDSDAAMLARAQNDYPHGEWQQASVESWQAEPDVRPDLIFSNAALHWLEQHPALFPRLLASLAPGGTLAVQMPANFDAPSHAELRALATEEPWQQYLGKVRMGAVLPASEYYRLLSGIAGLKLQRLDIWQTTYLQALSGEDAVVAWMRGTTLLPYLAALPEAQHEAFIDAYRQRIANAYPCQDGSTLFPFTRLFLIAET